MTARMYRMAIVLAMLASSGGCLMMRMRERVVREGEQRFPVRFQSAYAKRQFQQYALDDKARRKTSSSADLIIPFVIWDSDSSVLSQNAYYNNQIVSCDANSDGMLTDAEVAEYSSLMAQPAKIPADEPTAHATDEAKPEAQIGARRRPLWRR